jgi:hypothetical protein
LRRESLGILNADHNLVISIGVIETNERRRRIWRERCSAVIMSARRILSGLAGLALLAMPVGAAAGMPPGSFPSVSVMQPTPPVMRAAAWADAQFDEDGAPPPRLWYAHYDSDDYPAQACDEDGDNCCDGQSYQESPAQYQDYGRQYGAPPYYNGRPDLLSERQRLVRQLDDAEQQFLAARDAGDPKLSARWAHHIKKLNHRLAALDAQAADTASNFHPPVSPYPYAGNPPSGYPPDNYPPAGPPPAGYPSAGYPPAGSPYAPGYGANPNGASPNGTSGLGGMINSLLGRTGAPPAGYPSASYPSASYPPAGPPPAGSPYAPGSGANPNGASGLGGMINSLLGPSAGSPPPGSPPGGSPYAPGSGANPNGSSALGGVMNSLLGSFTGKGTAP